MQHASTWYRKNFLPHSSTSTTAGDSKRIYTPPEGKVVKLARAHLGTRKSQRRTLRGTLTNKEKLHGTPTHEERWKAARAHLRTKKSHGRTLCGRGKVARDTWTEVKLCRCRKSS